MSRDYGASFVVYASAHCTAGQSIILTGTPEFAPGDASANVYGVVNPDSLFIMDTVSITIDNTTAAADSYQIFIGGATAPAGLLLRGDTAANGSDTMHFQFPAGYPIKAWNAIVASAASTNRLALAPTTVPVRFINGAATATDFKAYITGHIEAQSQRAN